MSSLMNSSQTSGASSGSKKWCLCRMLSHSNLKMSIWKTQEIDSLLQNNLLRMEKPRKLSFVYRLKYRRHQRMQKLGD
jgi:hypothetical protein